MTVRAFYAGLGVDLPDRGGANVQVRCFADSDAHRRGDRNPSCSVNKETGAFNCFACGAKGGPYDAAVTLGKSPAEAMELLRRHGLADDDGEQPAPRPRSEPKAVLRPSEAALDSYQGALEADGEAVSRLETVRGWTADAIRALGLGLNGARVVFPVRDAGGALVNLLRYAPDPECRSGAKLLAESGCPRDLFPAPETLDGDSVWIVEGEPDAVAGRSLGLPAVAVPGTGTRRPEWAERFAGRHVVVCLDCDRQGREAAQQIATDLLAHAAEVRILDLDPRRDDGYDLGDLALEAGPGGRRECRRMLGRMAAEVETLEPPASEDGAALLDDLAAFVRRFVVVTHAQAVAVALWIVHTHAVEAAETTPYLSITSAEKESGKTRLLEVLDTVVARPWFTGRVTAAVLVRKVDAEHPTLLLDESDAAFKGERDYAEALRGLLNTGYRATGRASLCVGQGAGITYRDFSTFGAKAIAGIGELPDTVASRAVAIRLERRAPGEHVDRWRERQGRQDGAALRERVEAWVGVHMDALREAVPEAPPQLRDRAQDTAEPLLAIADLAGRDWPQRSRAALLELRGEPAAEASSDGVRLLADVRAAFEQSGADRLGTVDLLKHLHGLDEAPWAEWRNGRPLTARVLGDLLKRYRIRSRTVRLADGTTPKGYKREQFEDAWRRYLPSNPHASRHNATTRMATGKTADSDRPQDRVVADGEEAENPHGDWDVADVADAESADGLERSELAADADNVVPIACAAEALATADDEAEVERLGRKGYLP